MRANRVVRLALGLFASMAVFVACSSNDARPPAATSFGAPGNGNNNGTNTSDAAVDAAADVDAGDPCAALALGGQTVEEQLLALATPPAIGGTIVPGIYDLTELDAYDPGASMTSLTGRSAQATLVLTANEIRVTASRSSSDAGAPVTDVHAYSFVVSGTSLTATELCPNAGNASTIPFTASGGGFAIQTDATHRELYHAR